MTTSEMTLSYRLFPSGGHVPGTLQTIFPLSGGAKMTLAAQTTLFEAGTPNPEYAFLFWDINSEAYYGNQAPPHAPPKVGTATFAVPSSAFQATAWYIGPIGGGGGEPIVALSAFSLDKQAVLTSASPFVSVSAGTVAGLATRTSGSAPAVTITAESVFSPDGRFKSWFVYGGTGTTPSASPNEIAVLENDGCSALAFYGLTQLSPDPCQNILNEIKKFGLFPPNEPMPPALATLFKNLASCQAAHGEPVFTPTKT